MAHRHLQCAIRICVCGVFLLIAVFGFQYSVVRPLLQPDELPRSVPFKGTVTNPRSAHALFDSESLQYVPRSVVRTWKKRGFLIVLGIPSIEMDVRRRRRYLQRTSCWRFPGVATRANNFTGAMLVLYVLARHPSHNFTYSAGLEAEAEQWHDVIALPMNEGRPSTNKTIGDLKWGNEAEIGLSRKVFLWFDMALRLFPTATYFAKGDDDTFLRVPQYLADLRSLPRRGVYWGLPVGATAQKGNVTHKFHYFSGMCYTLARDVVQQLVSFKPVRRLVHVPYTKRNEAAFLYFNMQHEDVMVGQILRLEVRYPALVIVADCWIRFHIGRDRAGKLRAKFTSVALHFPPEYSYGTLMDLFGDDTLQSTVLWKWRYPGLIKFFC